MSYSVDNKKIFNLVRIDYRIPFSNNVRNFYLKPNKGTKTSLSHTCINNESTDVNVDNVFMSPNPTIKITGRRICAK